MIRGLAGSQDCYKIDNSLMLDSGSSQYLSRTPSVSGNRKTWTFSCWAKRGRLGTTQVIFSGGAGVGGPPDGFVIISFTSADKILVDTNNIGNYLTRVTTAVYRDISSWYHIQLAFDTTQTVGANKAKLFVNGKLITTFDTDVTTLATNSDWGVNSTVVHRLGESSYLTGGVPYNGYLSECYFIDGQALDPSYFGRSCPFTGEWEPKKYTGTYGANGFYLEFKDTGAGSNAGLGKDTSGNGNYWTTNGGIVAGNQYIDTPTNNFCVLNAIAPNGMPVPSWGNLLSSSVESVGWYRHTVGTITIPSTGKWYWEYQNYGSVGTQDHIVIGLIQNNLPVYTGSYTQIGAFAGSHGAYVVVGTGAASTWYSDGSAGTQFQGTALEGNLEGTWGSVFGIAFDADTGVFELFQNGVSKGTRNIPLGQAGTLLPAATIYIGNLRVNFGQRAFEYPVAGFKSLCTKNLPTPTIKRPEKYFKTLTYTGNGANLQVGEVQKAQDLITIGNSLRFNSADSAYLGRTPTVATNGTVWTWSGWVKRAGNTGALNVLMSVGTLAAAGELITIDTNGTILQNLTVGNVSQVVYNTIQAVLDNSRFVHVHVQRNGNNRYIWLDGIAQTLTSTIVNAATASYFGTNAFHAIGAAYWRADAYLSGYLSDVYFIDGQALTPSSFGQFDGNNYWVPKAYTGTYGTNGFHLDFADNTNIGNDIAGTNDWTANNFTATGGSPNQDLVVDSPTNSYATIDAVISDPHLSYKQGNLYASINSNQSGNSPVYGSGVVNKGKWYWEVVFPSIPTTNGIVGTGIYGLLNPLDSVVITANNADVQQMSFSWQNYPQTGLTSKRNGTTDVTYGTVIGGGTTGTIIGIALDLDNYTLTFYRNNVSQGIAYSNLPEVYYRPFSTIYLDATSSPIFTDVQYNFGSQGFTYTPPTGFLPLCENNIREYLYDVETADLVWIKSRSAATNHMLFDSVRGAKNYLISNSTAASASNENSLIQFNKNGFYLGNQADVNTLNATYAAWTWKKGVTLGFDIVSYTGNGANRTIAHGLGVAPAMVIYKALTVRAWYVYHSKLSSPTLKYLALNTADAESGNDVTMFNSTAPNSSVLSLGTNNNVNANGEGYIAYTFAEVAGFSKFGSYVGNGSVVGDGPFVYCGFRPAYVMLKRYDGGADGWYVYDSKRDDYNGVTSELVYVNLSNAVNTTDIQIDFLSNGFKTRVAGSYTPNQTNATYIFAAFAEMPFKYSNAR